MTHDQIWFNFWMLFEGFVDPVCMPDRIFKGSTAVMCLLRGATAWFVLDELNPFHVPGRKLRNKGAPETFFVNEVLGDVSELGRKIFVNKEDVHELFFACN